MSSSIDDSEPVDPYRRPSKLELLVGLVNDNLRTILGVLLIAGAGALYVGYEPTVPRFWKIAAVAGGIMAPWSYLVAQWIKNRLFNPFMVYVVDVDAAEVDGALWAFELGDFLELEVTEGSIERTSPTLAFAKDVDPDELTAEGTWRGTLTDRELLSALHLVDECRGQLEDDAKVGFMFNVIGWSVIRQGITQTTQYVVQTFHNGALPDKGEGLDRVVDDALERYDLKRQFRKAAEDIEFDASEFEALDPQGEDALDRLIGNGDRADRPEGREQNLSRKPEASHD